jgi:hypothetical protein
MRIRFSGILFLVPILFLVWAAIPRLWSGLVWDAAYPATDNIPLNFAPIEGQGYADVAAILSRADARDGTAHIIRAEALFHAGVAPSVYLPVLEEGLAARPASARGWTLLANAELQSNPDRATNALAMALRLAPLDYRIVEQRSRAGAALWRRLGAAEREILFTQTRLLWSDPVLQEHILNRVLLMPGGPELIGAAFAEMPEELRAINRLTEQRRMMIYR